MSARRVLLMLGGVLTILLAAFTTWGLNHRPAERSERSTSLVAAEARADSRFNPKNVVVSQGHNRGELIVSWALPIRPDVVATVIYAGAASAQARAIVNYGRSPENVPRATVHGLPRGQKICLSAVHVVSRDDTITNTEAHPVCAVPR